MGPQIPGKPLVLHRRMFKLKKDRLGNTRKFEIGHARQVTTVLSFVVFNWMINWPCKFQVTSHGQEKILVLLSMNCSSESTVIRI